MTHLLTLATFGSDHEDRGYLLCTSTLALIEVWRPRRLFATQWYSPPSWNTAFRIRNLEPLPVILILILLSSVIASPFFFHLIRGLGFPVAAQFNANPLPSFMVLFFGCTIMIGGTPKDKKELMLLTAKARFSKDNVTSIVNAKVAWKDSAAPRKLGNMLTRLAAGLTWSESLKALIAYPPYRSRESPNTRSLKFSHFPRHGC